MKLVQISLNDRMGERFNGLAIRPQLAAAGIDSTHLVWNRTVDEPHVRPLLPYPGVRAMNDLAAVVEDRLSLQSMLQAQAFALAAQTEYREADLAHYHIIQESFFSLQALPFLTRGKPSVWTWHDPWPLTGHCLHPLDCDHWKVGCGACPDLERLYPLRQDKTARNARLKKGVYDRSRLHVIVASAWMAQMAQASPLTANLKVHTVPFGIDTSLYGGVSRAEARARLGIDAGRVVIAFRAQTSPFKGLADIKAAIDRLKPSRPIAIVAIQETGHFDALLGGPHQVIDAGFLREGAEMATAMAAADLFLMPSSAESFGLMALEAMASGAAVLAYEGTATPAIIQAPDVGLTVRQGDASALAAQIERLIAAPDELAERGRLSRALALQEYTVDRQVQRLCAVYAEALSERSLPFVPAGRPSLPVADAPRAARPVAAPQPPIPEADPAARLREEGAFTIGYVGEVHTPDVIELLKLLNTVGWSLGGRAVRLRALGGYFSAHDIPQGRLEITPWSTMSELAEGLEGCDVLFWPAPFDGPPEPQALPPILLAGFAAGKPVVLVAPTEAPLAHFVVEAQAGRCATGRHSAALFNAFAHLAADPVAYARLSAGARRVALHPPTALDPPPPAPRVLATSRERPRRTPSDIERAPGPRLLQRRLSRPSRPLNLDQDWAARKHPADHPHAFTTGLDPWGYVAALHLPPRRQGERYLSTTISTGGGEEVFLLLANDDWGQTGERLRAPGGTDRHTVWIDLAEAPDAAFLVIQAGASPDRALVRVDGARLHAPLMGGGR